MARDEETRAAVAMLRQLRRVLSKTRLPDLLPPLPRFNGGGACVDIADREALYRLMADQQ